LEIVTLVPVPAIEPGLIIHVPVAGSPVSTTLPVVATQEDGWVIVPMTGAEGATGAGLITTLADPTEIHPASLVTLKVYVPGARSLIVVIVPVPAIDPGLMVHVPAEGRPVNTTIPVGAAQEAGWVTVPILGAGGAVGAALIFTAADASDIHPASLVT
jgi:hypothetical protein